MSARTDSKTARFRRHADRSRTMPCGREVYGNGGRHAHQNRCRECLTKDGAYLSEWVRRGIFLNLQSSPPEARMAAYAEWKRREGDRLLAEMGGES